MAIAINRPKKQAIEGVRDNRFIYYIKNANFFSGWMGYFSLMAACGLFYIANLHYANRNIRTLNHLRKEVAELRTEYTMLRAQFILGSKRSIIKNKVHQLGLIENDKPAYQLIAD
ncbi:MAG: FtsL-like putative cell division protein [Cytophagales bacterium]|nr:FtsL-like putative cell division protein [Bernardetiaceae bacterium]MDW8205759.1 FtsL-like putative cell division protein [Cytophagales bacterium]